MYPFLLGCFFFFFNDTATTEIYTLSLHDALPISGGERGLRGVHGPRGCSRGQGRSSHRWLGILGEAPNALRLPEEEENYGAKRSEEHTSELQSHSDLVCRLLLEKKKNKNH